MKQVLSRIAVMIMAVAATLGMGAAPALASEEENANAVLEITKYADKDVYTVDEEITYTIEVEQTVEGVTAHNICIADNFPDETRVQDISISGVDGDSYIIPWRDEDVVKADVVSLGETDGDEFTDVDVQLAFADGIEIPTNIVIFLDITYGTDEFNGSEIKHQVYDECLVFSADSGWQGRFENVPCIDGAEYEIYVQETVFDEMYTLEEANRYEISGIEGSIAEGLSCTVDAKSCNYSITKISELAYGETAVITTKAVASAAADDVVNNVMATAYGIDESGSGEEASGPAFSEATINIVEAGDSVSEQGEEGSETEDQISQESQGSTGTSAIQDNSDIDYNNSESKAVAENVKEGKDGEITDQVAQETQYSAETKATQDDGTISYEDVESEADAENLEGEISDIYDMSVTAETYNDEEWENDEDYGVDNATAAQTGDNRAMNIAIIIGCAAAAAVVTIIARKGMEIS